jgi:putative lumazine-binding protein
MSRRTNEADIAAVTEVVRAYYDGMIEGDAAKLGRAFHPRASIVGNEGGELSWATLEEFAAECEGAVSQAGPYEWRIESLSFEGDTPGQAWRPIRRRVVQRRPVSRLDRQRLAHRPQDVLPTPHGLRRASERPGLLGATSGAHGARNTSRMVRTVAPGIL